jgi:serine/threonine protein kinase
VKQINPELIQQDRISFLKGVVDLATETRYLSRLDHNNVIKLEGVAACDAFTKGYFIILERVNLTLAKRVKEWMDVDRTCKGITGVFTGSKKKVHKLQTDRMTAAYDLACGMNYLHQRNIVFRDLVRFDNRIGTSKTKTRNVNFTCLTQLSPSLSLSFFFTHSSETRQRRV